MIAVSNGRCRARFKMWVSFRTQVRVLGSGEVGSTRSAPAKSFDGPDHSSISIITDTILEIRLHSPLLSSEGQLSYPSHSPKELAKLGLYIVSSGTWKIVTYIFTVKGCNRVG